MSNRNKVIGGFILLLAVLTSVHYLFGVFTTYNYFTAKWDILNNHPRILLYGKPLVSDKQAVKIAQDYGFEYKIVAGCIVTTPFVNGVDSYNAVVKNYLNTKLGNDWESRFESSVDSLYKLEVSK